ARGWPGVFRAGRPRGRHRATVGAVPPTRVLGSGRERVPGRRGHASETPRRARLRLSPRPAGHVATPHPPVAVEPPEGGGGRHMRSSSVRRPAITFAKRGSDATFDSSYGSVESSYSSCSPVVTYRTYAYRVDRTPQYAGTPARFFDSMRKRSLQEAVGERNRGSRFMPAAPGAPVPATAANVGARSMFTTRCRSVRGVRTSGSYRTTNGTRMLSS